MATSGPGATNLVTGIADAQIDSTPMVCITGQVASHLLGSDAFQETDIIGISTPVTKWNYQITKASEIPEIMAKAFYIARTGRPGPVLIDITKMHSLKLLTTHTKNVLGNFGIFTRLESVIPNNFNLLKDELVISKLVGTPSPSSSRSW